MRTTWIWLVVFVGCASPRTVAPHVAAPVPVRGAAVQAPAPHRALPGVSPVMFHNARLLDGTGGPPRSGVDVRVEGDRIVEIGTGLTAGPGVRVIDLDGHTLMPGFIDAHVHLTMEPSADFASSVVREVRETDADRALAGGQAARATLQAGFTTVRDVGSSFAARALRDAIAQGRLPGPRMLVANHAIGITGGHCDGSNGYRDDVWPTAADPQHGVADGTEDMRKAVRYQIKHGADVIKLCATGGVMSVGDGVGASQLTLDELRVAVTEAHRAERRVAAHAHGTEGIRDAVEAGVDSIEHGSILDNDAVRAMVRSGTFLVPTLWVGHYVEARARDHTLAEEVAQKALAIAPQMRASFRLAYKGGVRIALGSDAGVFDHGDNGHEFAEMVAQGMKPADAIVAGTTGAAELLGLRDVGQVTVGAFADLVVVDGDPLADIDTLLHPLWVMKAGVLYVEPTPSTP